MKGFKTASGVFAIIEGLGALLCGIAFAVLGGIGGGMLDGLLDSFGESLEGFDLSSLPFNISVFFIAVGVILAVLGLIYFILGIKACKSSSGKGTAIALLIFSIFMFNPLVFIFSIIYLATRGSQNQNYSGGGKNYGSDDTYV